MDSQRLGGALYYQRKRLNRRTRIWDRVGHLGLVHAVRRSVSRKEMRVSWEMTYSWQRSKFRSYTILLVRSSIIVLVTPGIAYGGTGEVVEML
jgi:hypothetical protein